MHMYRLADNGNRVAKIKVVFESKIRIEQCKGDMHLKPFIIEKLHFNQVKDTNFV